ncbi:MAG: hypothetical protein C0415_01285 [Thermodesulfovibrio sp.]|nr:hypothetical protein [Thermodesulfovibrio sp.]
MQNKHYPEEENVTVKNIRQKNKRISIVVIAFLVFAILHLAYISACSNKKEPVKKPPIPVVVSNVVQKPVPLQLTAIGNVEAYSTINVKSPIGLAVVGGLLFSQIITLYITPVFYLYMESFQKWISSKSLFLRKRQKKERYVKIGGR